jgi:hypothetical protein
VVCADAHSNIQYTTLNAEIKKEGSFWVERVVWFALYGAAREREHRMRVRDMAALLMRKRRRKTPLGAAHCRPLLR